ncbi:MAG: glycine betaine ABC transporter substrate-binding protein [Jatrophihabitans sp.]|uniref:ABC transporter substrate-binding protein n=1 Tax=Jatrophihabitans sp. TaxID=1932789 RepID=UPI00390F787E
MKSTGVFGRTVTAGIAVALAATLAACGSSGGKSKNSGAASGGAKGSTSNSQPGKGKPAIVMGDKNFAEQYLLGELYKQALQAKGFTVTLKGNIGSSTVIDKALTSGKIQWYPEYSGVIYTELAKLGDRPKSAEITLQGATDYEKKRGFTVLAPTPFQDADGMAVSNKFAQQHGLKTIDDLKKVKSFTYGGPPENGTRFQGVKGLQQAYGLHNFTFKPVPIGSQYQALDQGKLDSIAIFTTDGQLASKKYTVLTDTKGIFGFQQVVPVVKNSLITAEGPAFAQTLNAVSALLSTDAIVALNKAVQIDQKDPAVVAKAFLQANHLA